MTNEKTKPEEAAQPLAEAAAPKATKPGMMKKLMPILLFGVGGLVLLGSAVAVTLFLLGTEPSAEATKADDNTAATSATDPASPAVAKVDSTDDAIASDDSLDAAADSAEAAAEITRNIAAMADAMADHDDLELGASAPQDDSLEAADWLNTEKQKLTLRETDLAAREKELQKKDYEVSQKLLKVEQVSADRVTNLAKLYDGMDSDAVAKIMSNLEDDLVVAIIPRMKQKNASTVMALLPPQRAAKLSRQIITLASE